MQIKNVKYIVSGIVQGVGFRYYTCQQGVKLGLVGYAKNLTNGDVEVSASGSEEDLDLLYQWLKKGPKTANVEKVTVKACELQEFTSFTIKY